MDLEHLWNALKGSGDAINSLEIEHQISNYEAAVSKVEGDCAMEEKNIEYDYSQFLKQKEILEKQMAFDLVSLKNKLIQRNTYIKDLERSIILSSKNSEKRKRYITKKKEDLEDVRKTIETLEVGKDIALNSFQVQLQHQWDEKLQYSYTFQNSSKKYLEDKLETFSMKVSIFEKWQNSIEKMLEGKRRSLESIQTSKQVIVDRVFAGKSALMISIASLTINLPGDFPMDTIDEAFVALTIVGKWTVRTPPKPASTPPMTPGPPMYQWQFEPNDPDWVVALSREDLLTGRLDVFVAGLGSQGRVVGALDLSYFTQDQPEPLQPYQQSVPPVTENTANRGHSVAGLDRTDRTPSSTPSLHPTPLTPSHLDTHQKPVDTAVDPASRPSAQRSSRSGSPSEGASWVPRLGARVEGNFAGEGRWYAATVTAVDQNTEGDWRARLHYDDGDTEDGVPLALMRPIPTPAHSTPDGGGEQSALSNGRAVETEEEAVSLAGEGNLLPGYTVGDVVEAYDEEDEDWYEARVLAVSNSKYDLEFASGERRTDVKASQIRAKVLAVSHQAVSTTDRKPPQSVFMPQAVPAFSDAPVMRAGSGEGEKLGLQGYIPNPFDNATPSPDNQQQLASAAASVTSLLAERESLLRIPMFDPNSDGRDDPIAVMSLRYKVHSGPNINPVRPPISTSAFSLSTVSGTGSGGWEGDVVGAREWKRDVLAELGDIVAYSKLLIEDKKLEIEALQVQKEDRKQELQLQLEKQLRVKQKELEVVLRDEIENTRADSTRLEGIKSERERDLDKGLFEQSQLAGKISKIRRKCESISRQLQAHREDEHYAREAFVGHRNEWMAFFDSRSMFLRNKYVTLLNSLHCDLQRLLQHGGDEVVEFISEDIHSVVRQLNAMETAELPFPPFRLTADAVSDPPPPLPEEPPMLDDYHPEGQASWRGERGFAMTDSGVADRTNRQQSPSARAAKISKSLVVEHNQSSLFGRRLPAYSAYGLEYPDIL